MQVYIMQELEMYEDAEPDSTLEDHQDTAEEFNELSALMKSYSVYHTLELTPEYTRLTIYQQKITLDEFAMNALFYRVLALHFEIRTEYAWLGGLGCDFSLNVYRID